MVPWVHTSQSPNGISIGSAIFAGLKNVNNTHRDTGWLASNGAFNTIEVISPLKGRTIL